MKLKACLLAGLLGLTFGPVSAQPVQPTFSGELLTPSEAAGIVRSMGFVPTNSPVREGQTYTVRAVGPRGRQVRVVVDARFGDVLSVRPVAALGAPYPVPPGRIAVRPVPYEYDRPWFGPQFRPPAAIGRSDAYSPPPVPRARPASNAAQPSQKSAAGSAAPPANSQVLTVRPAAPGADPTPTGSTKPPAFPPAQTLE